MGTSSKKRLKKRSLVNLVRLYITSCIDRLINSKKIVEAERTFKEVQTYCVFIGYARSGHTLVGALIDAHPNAMISIELNALRYVRAGFNKWQIYSMIVKKSEKFARKKGRAGPDYTYFVPNQWHGKYSRLVVIGDKKGGGSANSLATSHKLLEKLQKTINSDIKFIHVIRNPYDNISTISRRSKENDLKASIKSYFSQCEAVMKIKERVDPVAILDIRHESLIKDPREAVTQICDFLGLEPFEDYVKDCASIIYESPHKSRHKAEWTDELIALVAQKMSKYPFLEGYSFEE